MKLKSYTVCFVLSVLVCTSFLFGCKSTDSLSTEADTTVEPSNESSNLLVSLTMDGKAQKLTFPTAGDIEVTADFYGLPENTKLILACHQAGYSRGEYIEIAPKLLAKGFNVLAIDQRSGGSVNQIDNETAIAAYDAKLRTSFNNAFSDVEAALEFSTTALGYEKVYLMGSSYSSALSLVAGSKYPDKIYAVMAFSPSESVRVDDKRVIEHLENISIPIFIESPISETDRWKEFTTVINKDLLTTYVDQEETKHGASCLWPTSVGSERHWEQVLTFLDKMTQ